jgi:hypothetical protein
MTALRETGYSSDREFMGQACRRVRLGFPSWANLVRSGSGLDGFDDPRDMVG